MLPSSGQDSVCFQNRLYSRFLRDSWDVGDFTDVTLVTEDGDHIQAHQLVLGFHSPVLRKLFRLASGSSQTQVLVYLRGVRRDCLDLLMRLVYMGEVEVDSSLLDEFIALGRELDIVGIQKVLKTKPEDEDEPFPFDLDKSSFLVKQEGKENREFSYAYQSALSKKRTNLGSTEELCAEDDKEREYERTSTLLESDTEVDISQVRPIYPEGSPNIHLSDTMVEVEEQPGDEKESANEVSSRMERSNPTKEHIFQTLTNDNQTVYHINEAPVIVKANLVRGEEKEPFAASKPAEERNTETQADASACNKNEAILSEKQSSILCKECGSNFATKKGLWFHTQSKHLGVTHQCEECDKVYNTKPALNKHRSVIHKGLRYQCTECAQVFRSPRSLRNHMRRHNGEKDICKECDQVFRDEISLGRHKNQEHVGMSVEMYFCNMCDWSGTRRKLSIHKQNVHEGMVFNCDKCDFKATQRAFLINHMALRHGSKKFNCSICEKSFRQEAILNRHIQSTHDGDWHFCDQCDRSFPLLASLNTHKTRVHENTKRENFATKKGAKRNASDKYVTFPCIHCDFSSSTPADLKKHVNQVHDKNYQCDKCESSFNELKKLETHVKNRHVGVSYNCDKCKFKSIIKADLIDHKETAHVILK